MTVMAKAVAVRSEERAGLGGKRRIALALALSVVTHGAAVAVLDRRPSDPEPADATVVVDLVADPAPTSDVASASEPPRSPEPPAEENVAPAIPSELQKSEQDPPSPPVPDEPSVPSFSAPAPVDASPPPAPEERTPATLSLPPRPPKSRLGTKPPPPRSEPKGEGEVGSPRQKNTASPASIAPSEKSAASVDAAPAAAPPPDHPPEIDAHPAPSYPSVARQRGVQGKAVVRVDVDTVGRPAKLTVLSSSGSSALDRAATDGVQRWTFRPARKNGNVVEGQIDIPIEFRILDE